MDVERERYFSFNKWKILDEVTEDFEESNKSVAPDYIAQDEGHMEYVYIAVALLGLIITIGSIGNILVIYIVKTTKKLQVVSNVFIVNLSVCDLCFVCCVLPFSIYTFNTDGWYFSKHLCKFIGFMGYTLTGTIIITITLIAYNRYKLVLDPNGYKTLYTTRNIAIMVTCAWVVPVLSLLPAILEIWGQFGYVAMLVTCNLLLDHKSQSYKLFLLIVRAGIPCILIVFYYTRIFLVARRSREKLCHARSRASAGMAAYNKREMHLTKMMVTIFVVFILSYFPCSITGMIDWHTVLSKQFHMFCATTVYIGSAMNPLIYGFMNTQFREAYLRLLCCRRVKNKHNESGLTTGKTTQRQIKWKELKPPPGLKECKLSALILKSTRDKTVAFCATNNDENNRLTPSHIDDHDTLLQMESEVEYGQRILNNCSDK